MRRHRPGPRASRHEAGFHRVDLTVCIALVLLLGVLGMAASSQGEREARVAKCRSNLWELHKVSVAYGEAHGGETPPAFPLPYGGYWPWDVSTETADALVSLGVRREVFYCPSSPTYYDIDVYWNFLPSYRVLGYVFVTRNVRQVPVEDCLFVPSPPHYDCTPQVVTNYAMANPGSLPYIVDATLSYGANQVDREVNQYTQVVGGFPDKPHACSHRRGRFPEGGHLMMLDGHLEWRAFEQMKVRTGSFDYPAFWW